MEDFTRLLRERLFAAFYNWLDVNEDAIGKWYEDLYRKGRDTEASCNTLMKIIGDAMWMLNMISNLGVYAGVGPNNFDLQQLADNIDRTSTTRLLALISSCLAVQGLPLEIMNLEIPIISSKKFSLQLYTRQREAT